MLCSVVRIFNAKPLGMKKYIYLLLLLAACQSPRQAFEAGEYDKAFKKALDRFEHSQGDPELHILMRRSAEQILQREHGLRDQLYASDDPADWAEALDRNADLQEQLSPALPYLQSTLQFELDGLQSEYQRTRPLIYQAYLDRGRQRMLEFDTTGRKSTAQAAYFDFRHAEEYAGNSVEASLDSLLKAARKGGTLQARVELDPPFFYRFDTERALDHLAGPAGDFYQLSYNLHPAEADCVIRINFSDVDVDEWEDSSEDHHTKEVITGHETKRDTSGNSYEVPVYEEVSGTVAYITHHKRASLSVSVNIINQSGQCTMSGCSFSDQVEARDEQIEISGDTRAIPSHITETHFSDLPDDDDLAEELIDALARRVVGCLR